MEISKTKIIIFAVATLVAGAAIGCGFEYYNSYQQTKRLISNILPVRQNNFNYKFIYPLLRYDFGDAKYYLEDKNLEQKISGYVQQQYKNKNAQSISVYFSNLLTGEWSGINPDSKYTPGSIMKIFIMMAYFREKQFDQSILQKTLVYTQEVDKAVHRIPYVNPINLTVGQSYTVQYLIEDMIENSDDAADTLLLLNVSQDILNDAFKDLDVAVPGMTQNYSISPKEYTYFLRILYSSTYLTEKNSESALSIMSKSKYYNGIYAGVPSSIVIAQKYGESYDIDSQSKKIIATYLNNCGIIYAKPYPYTLCVMTKAEGQTDKKELASIIKNISEIVYDYASSGKK